MNKKKIEKRLFVTINILSENERAIDKITHKCLRSKVSFVVGFKPYSIVEIMISLPVESNVFKDTESLEISWIGDDDGIEGFTIPNSAYEDFLVEQRFVSED